MNLYSDTLVTSDKQWLINKTLFSSLVTSLLVSISIALNSISVSTNTICYFSNLAIDFIKVELLLQSNLIVNLNIFIIFLIPLIFQQTP